MVSTPPLLHPTEEHKTLGTLYDIYLHRLASAHTRRFPTYYQVFASLILLKFRSCTVPYLFLRLSISLFPFFSR
jgi:hypothetical protein